ncbi:sensor histidine kinase [Paenibacillus koleovorans]|uniref:sensor histidine kinase n=1 Tax=Paenibacillus koleovorans TaxID=121608 RepID=UPI000FD788D0|nr:histidine kinase [Paenibacillus koleovorans]
MKEIPGIGASKGGSRFAMRMRRFSILGRLIVSLLIIIIPLYALNFVLNETSANTNKKEMTQNLQESSRMFHKLLETELQQISMLLNKNTIKIALLMTGSEASGSAEELQLKMNIQNIVIEMQNASHYIRKAQAILPTMGSKVTYNEFSRISEEDLPTFGLAPTRGFVNWRNGLYMTVPYLNNGIDERRGVVVLAAQLDEPSIREVLNNVVGYEEGGAIWFDPEMGWSVTSSGTHAIGAKLVDLLKQNVQNGGPLDNNPYITLDKRDYFVSYSYSSVLGTSMLTYAPTDIIFNSLKRYRLNFQIMSVLALGIIVFISIWIYRTVHNPLQILTKAFREVEKGRMDVSIRAINDDEFGYIYTRFTIMLGRLKETIHNVYELEIRNQRSELKRLQAQINPHFLYNSFFVLSRLVRRGDNDKATQFAQFLGQYFQFITRDHEDLIELERELEHARTYADIQAICHPRLQIAFAPLPRAYWKVLVPRLILQPLIENAYKHGFNEKYSNGEIAVRIETGRGEIRLVVEDTGQGIGAEELEQLKARLDADDGDSSGLVNVHRRVRLYRGGDSGISISASTMGGVKIELKLRMEE